MRTEVFFSWGMKVGKDPSLPADLEKTLRGNPMLIAKLGEGVFGSIGFTMTVSVSDQAQILFDIHDYEERTQEGLKLHIHTQTTSHSIELLAPTGDVVLPPTDKIQVLHETGGYFSRLIRIVEESAPKAMIYKSKEFESRSRSSISKARDLLQRGLFQDSQRLVHLAVEEKLKATMLSSGVNWGHYETPHIPRSAGKAVLECLGVDRASPSPIARYARRTARAKNYLCQLRERSFDADLPMPRHDASKIETSLLGLAEQETQNLLRKGGVVAVFLSGSVARGWGGEESDLDLIVVERFGEDFHTKGQEMARGGRQIHVADSFFRLDVAEHLISQGVSTLPAMMQDAIPIYDPDHLLDTWRGYLCKREFWRKRRAMSENTFFWLIARLEDAMEQALHDRDLPLALMAYRHIWDCMCRLALCYTKVLEKGSKLFLRQILESQLAPWFKSSYEEIWGLRHRDPEQTKKLVSRASRILPKLQPNQRKA